MEPAGWHSLDPVSTRGTFEFTQQVQLKQLRDEFSREWLVGFKELQISKSEHKIETQALVRGILETKLLQRNAIQSNDFGHSIEELLTQATARKLQALQFRRSRDKLHQKFRVFHLFFKEF